ncbi:MAG TPA: hypothetical protein HA327_05535 [Candidatus Poseidoniaceae archaeon]|nr:MAG TPA: hypothetical protein D7H81_05465 [Candidatus Poseidoniales archaeon]HII45483.1 hypothetical protein [Candidatus Poseidoniaceae archaeon]
MIYQFRAVIIYGIIFSSLFMLHILFAANDLEGLFRVVVLLIAIMTFFSGPICVVIEPVKEQYKSTYFHGLILSMPLSTGLGWAYGDRSAGLEMILFPVITLVIHIAIRQSSIGLTYGLK